MLPTIRKKKLRIEGPEVPDGEAPHVGTAEGPTVDMEMRGGSFRQKRKWYRRWRRDTATLETLTWDGSRYILRRYDVAADEIPDTAVHVTGRSGRWFVDAVDRESRDDLKVAYNPDYKIPDAIDIHLYAINNAFNEALLIKGRTAPRDVKRIVLYIMIAGIAVCAAWVFIGPMLRRLPTKR